MVDKENYKKLLNHINNLYIKTNPIYILALDLFWSEYDVDYIFQILEEIDKIIDFYSLEYIAPENDLIDIAIMWFDKEKLESFRKEEYRKWKLIQKKLDRLEKKLKRKL